MISCHIGSNIQPFGEHLIYRRGPLPISAIGKIGSERNEKGEEENKDGNDVWVLHDPKSVVVLDVPVHNFDCSEENHGR